MIKDLGSRILMLVAVSGVGSAALAEPDVDYMAGLLMEAEARGDLYPDFLRIDDALDDATLYHVQKRFVALRLHRGARIGGYKGGFIPRAAIGGVLYADAVMQTGAVIDPRRHHTLLIEAEVAFRFCRRITEPLAGIPQLQDAICEIHPAVELPDAALPDIESVQRDFEHLRKALIATNMISAGVVLGAARDPQLIDFAGLQVALFHDGERIGRREPGRGDDDLWSKVLWVVNEFVLRSGYVIEPGQIIIPGNLTGIHPGIPGRYRAEFGALGMVEFTIGETP